MRFKIVTSVMLAAITFYCALQPNSWFVPVWLIMLTVLWTCEAWLTWIMSERMKNMGTKTAEQFAKTEDGHFILCESQGVQIVTDSLNISTSSFLQVRRGEELVKEWTPKDWKHAQPLWIAGQAVDLAIESGADENEIRQQFGM